MAHSSIDTTIRPAPLASGVLTALLGLLVLLAPPATGQEGPLLVATKVAAPFSMKTDDGSWTGISIELWDHIAGQMGVEYEFVEYDLEGMIDAVAAGEADVGVAATTVTAEREEILDFTHPFYHSGLGIAVEAGPGNAWVVLLRRLFSIQFAQAVVALGALLLGVGLVVWLFERKRNAEQFGGAVKGLGSGFWWSAVTMTTVGYGDKAPVTPAGRFVALVWMFASIIIISGFTAAIASALTVSSLDSSIRSPDDLYRARVGTVEASSAETHLRAMGLRLTTYPTIEDAVQALAGGRIEAAVYDAPILRYTISQQEEESIGVLPVEFEQQNYAIILPPGSVMREAINTELLRLADTEEWKALVNRYIGR